MSPERDGQWIIHCFRRFTDCRASHLLPTSFFSLSPARVPRGTEAVLELIWNQFIYNQDGVKELHRLFQELIIHDFSIP